MLRTRMLTEACAISEALGQCFQCIGKLGMALINGVL